MFDHYIESQIISFFACAEKISASPIKLVVKASCVLKCFVHIQNIVNGPASALSTHRPKYHNYFVTHVDTKLYELVYLSMNLFASS